MIIKFDGVLAAIWTVESVGRAQGRRAIFRYVVTLAAFTHIFSSVCTSCCVQSPNSLPGIIDRIVLHAKRQIWYLLIFLSLLVVLHLMVLDWAVGVVARADL